MLPDSAQIEALAPDRAALLVARRTARAELWSGLGRSEAALWGECEGADRYTVMVALSDLRSRCGCESPRSPCRHALALLLLAAATPEALPLAEPPAELSAWLGRRARSARKGSGDLAAQKKRAEAREERVQAGLDWLHTWLCDRVRVGLGELENQPPAFWQEAARRLEDHQIRGLPERLMRASERVGSSPEWPAEVLAELGRVALVAEAARRNAGRSALPEGLQADLRAQLGFSVRESDVLKGGERLRDDWLGLGSVAETLLVGNGLRAQRTWLVGRQSRRAALILRYEHPSEPLRARPSDPRPGRIWSGELVFYPSAFPQRVVPGPGQDAGPLTAPLPALGLNEGLDAAAQALGANPLLDRVLLLLEGVAPVRAGERTWLREGGGAALPLSPGPHWWLFALSGGHPVAVAGEWDGAQLEPLGALIDGAWRGP